MGGHADGEVVTVPVWNTKSKFPYSIARKSLGRQEMKLFDIYTSVYLNVFGLCYENYGFLSVLDGCRLSFS